jgi:REP element-mobilizing transposase RayT
MSRTGSRLPHAKRHLVRHDPHHVVLTVHNDIPPLHRREIRDLWFSLQAAASLRYPGVSFSLGCSMPDHIHLIVQAAGQAADISRAIQYLASKLARGINRIAGRSGQVFRDRFYARVLSTVSELVRAMRYVGQNPVKARLVRRPEDWAASSVPEGLGRARATGARSFQGWMYRLLGLLDDPIRTLARILSGEIRARSPGRSRQNRLPFGRLAPGTPN